MVLRDFVERLLQFFRSRLDLRLQILLGLTQSGHHVIEGSRQFAHFVSPINAR